MLSTANSVPDGFRELLEQSPAEAAVTREFFNQLGQRLRVRSEATHANHARDEAIVRAGGLEQTVTSLSAALADRDEQIASLTKALTTRGGEIELLNPSSLDRRHDKACAGETFELPR